MAPAMSHLWQYPISRRLIEFDPKKTSYKKINLSFSLQVSASDVDALYEVYKKDFLMFGYSAQVYKDIALKAESNVA